MTTTLRIGLVGDHDPTVVAHRAIPRALALAAEAAARRVEPTWLPTEAIEGEGVLFGFDALWCVPGSPYRSTEGALRAIGFARRQGRPFLGTCGGFQHVLVEYARSVLGWRDAGHAETAAPVDAAGTAATAHPRLVVTPLACSLVEAPGVVRFRDGSRLAAAYGRPEATEEYHCRFGLNPAFREALLSGPLRVAAADAAGDVRAVEIDEHPFFVATLFQPERAALAGVAPPIVTAFVCAAADRRDRERNAS